ncbi:hypothetical protein N7468_004216 [Penicillium chermesinum]|uniref:Polynucleotide 5'-hydroxyl-kinase GRC3 n=1 Tax=Penicillium chermesinum TaxID=63820 RepID=A0A9W9P866_9EURO|nr:uncharacterized protein N7468_004216 [Penicillium chermesinum]KAJ5239597.1 hypothetical protein N7468_004216 [Penicillium chermesinum]
MSAVAARKARQQQAQTVTAKSQPAVEEAASEPPSKRPRRSLESTVAEKVDSEPRNLRTRSKKQQGPPPTEKRPVTRQSTRPNQTETQSSGSEVDEGDNQGEQESYEESLAGAPEEMSEDEVASVAGDPDGYESPAETPAELQNFPLSKTRLNKSNIVYSDETTLCIRIAEKMNLALIGQYDLWVKRGVVSLMGAKLHPSPKLYRVYAPATHSLPVIKCVSSTDGAAEVEIKSCKSGLFQLRDLSPLYQRIWNGQNTAADKVTLKSAPKGSRRTFSVTENGFTNSDGVAFIDLDPGQPEFAPMGQIYLAHLKAPFFGPPFTHPSLDVAQDGKIMRAHHIGATSPKENPDHYALATMDLLDQYRSLLAQYPQCPLIVNYPGWIFGQGLEVATWLVKFLGLSDVVYMSEKGPSEVVEPLSVAAAEARVPLTILPSQPTDYVSRSSAQLRSMQVQSYFHMSHPEGINNPVWQGTPLSRTRPIVVDYAGPRQGIAGIMVMGSQIHPDMLREVLEGPPYLFAVSGTGTPPDPKASNCLGLALIRSVDPSSHKLELSTPIAPSSLRETFQQGHQLVLVRGQLDNPNWAVSEEYHAARAAERQYQQSFSVGKEAAASGHSKQTGDQASHARALAQLRERIRRASQVPWMTVVEDNSRRHREAIERREKSLWKLRKKAYPGSESETD